MLKQLNGSNVVKATLELASQIRKAGYPDISLQRSKPTVKYGQFYEARLPDSQTFAPGVLAFVAHEFPEHAGRNSPSVISVPDRMFHQLLPAFVDMRNYAESPAGIARRERIQPAPPETTVAQRFGLAEPKDYEILDENLNAILTQFGGMAPAIREAGRYLAELGVQGRAYASYRRIGSQAELESFLGTCYTEARKSIPRQTKAEKQREWAQAKADLAADRIESLAYDSIAKEEVSKGKDNPRPGNGRKATQASIRKLLDTSGFETMPLTADQMELLEQYEGVGAEYDDDANQEHNEAALTQFYTPDYLASRMAALARHHGFAGGSVLEPSCGVGRLIKPFANTEGITLTGFELDPNPYRIAKRLYPQAELHNAAFETALLDRERGTRQLPDKNPTWLAKHPFDLVIGNPPYGGHKNTYSGMLTPRFKQVEIAFVHMAGLLLKPGGLLVYLTARNFLSFGTAMQNDKAKCLKILDLVDAYRMPNGVFDRSNVGTDILVFRRKTN